MKTCTKQVLKILKVIFEHFSICLISSICEMSSAKPFNHVTTVKKQKIAIKTISLLEMRDLSWTTVHIIKLQILW